MSYYGSWAWYNWGSYFNAWKAKSSQKIQYKTSKTDSHDDGNKHFHDDEDTHSHQDGKGHQSHGNGFGKGHHKSRTIKDKVYARDDKLTVSEDGSAVANVLDNDKSKRGLDLEVISFGGADVGETIAVTTKGGRTVDVTLESDGTLTVVPKDGFDTLDAGDYDKVEIEYRVSNGAGKSDKGKIKITIDGADEAPVVAEVVADQVTIGENDDAVINVLDNDSGAEAVTSVSFGGETFAVGESFTVTSADGRTGTVTVEADGTLTFTGDGNFEDLNDGETDTVTVSYTVGDEGTPARVIDFDGLSRGDVVDNQFDGVTISAQRYKDKSHSENDAMIFDSNNPTGGDWDLRTSTQDNILIISEDNHSHDPDDNGKGGSIFLTFDEPETLESITFIDTEERPKLYLTLEDGSVEKIYGPETSNGGVARDFAINVEGVVSVEIKLKGSGAIDDIALGAKAGEAQTAEVVITIEGEGAPLAIEDDAFNLFENDTLNNNILTNDVAEGDLVVSSFAGLAAGETAEVTSADGRTGFITVGEDGSISFTADGDFETLAVGDSDTITFSYTAATLGGSGENLIVNGDFENNPLNNSGWTAVEAIEGWSSPVGHIEIQESNFGTGNTQGNAVVELDAHFNSTIEQTVSIEDAGTYTLSVDYAVRGSDFSTNGFDIIVNGEVVSSVRPDSRGFQNETVEVELAAGDAVIQFRGEGRSDSFGTVIDNVSLVSNTVSEDAGDATVTIVIDGVNDGPVAFDDAGSTTEADDESFAPVTGNVLTNDTDVDGDALSVLSVEGEAGDVGQIIDVTSDGNGFAGTAQINADGSLTVTPGAEFAALNNGESDTVTITYVVSDGNGGTDEAEVVVTINGAGEAFEIVDDSNSVFENDTLTDNVLSNDSSDNGLSVYSFAGVDAGETAEVVSADGRTGFVTVNADGTLSFTADGDFESLAVGDTDTVTFTYAAGSGTPRGENLVINGDFEDNPLANTGSVIVDEITGWEATAGNVSVQESDFDTGNTEGNAVVELDSNINATIQQVVTIPTAGDFVFSLDYAMRGTDAATNGFGVRIDGVEVATEFPTEPGFQTLEVGVSLAAGDVTIEIFGLGDSDGVGTVVDNVALQSAGVAGQQDTAEVTITIDGVNDNPVAANDFATTNEDIGANVPAITGNVLDNDSDIDTGDVLTVVAVSGIAGAGVVGQSFNVVSDVNGFTGTAQINADGSLTVTPGDGFSALGGGESDTITIDYSIEDGNGGQDAAQVIVTVNGADNGVAANNDAVSVFENDAALLDVLANDTGSDLFVDTVNGNNAGQPFLATTEGGRQLQVQLLPNGRLTVAANEEFDNLAFGATDTVRLDYTVEDGSGSTAAAFIDVTIVGVNDDIRVFVDEDEAIEVNQGSVGSGQVFIIDADGNPGLVDIDGDAAQFSLLSQGGFVTATINQNTGEFTFTGEFGFFGEDSFNFEVTDGLSFDTGTVFVEIVNVGQAPVIDETASDLSVGASALIGFLSATGTITAFDADDFDFTIGNSNFPDDILDLEVRAGVQVNATGSDDDELLGELFGEFVGGALDLGELTGSDRSATFDFNLETEELVGILLDEGLDAVSLATASIDLTYTIQVTDQTTRSSTSELTITIDSDDLIGILTGTVTGLVDDII